MKYVINHNDLERFIDIYLSMTKYDVVGGELAAKHVEDAANLVAAEMGGRTIRAVADWLAIAFAYVVAGVAAVNTADLLAVVVADFVESHRFPLRVDRKPLPTP